MPSLAPLEAGTERVFVAIRSRRSVDADRIVAIPPLRSPLTDSGIGEVWVCQERGSGSVRLRARVRPDCLCGEQHTGEVHPGFGENVRIGRAVGVPGFEVFGLDEVPAGRQLLDGPVVEGSGPGLTGTSRHSVGVSWQAREARRP